MFVGREDRLLTVYETCESLHISKVTLYELIRTGQLASLRIGRARRIPASAVAAFIESRTVGGAA